MRPHPFINILSTLLSCYNHRVEGLQHRLQGPQRVKCYLVLYRSLQILSLDEAVAEGGGSCPSAKGMKHEYLLNSLCARH